MLKISAKDSLWMLPRYSLNSFMFLFFVSHKKAGLKTHVLICRVGKMSIQCQCFVRMTLSCLDQGGSRNFFSCFNKFGQSTLMRLAQTVQWGKAVGWATGDLRYFPHKIRVGNELAESRKYSLLAGASREPLSKCITVFCARGPGLGWDQQRQ